MSKFYGEFWADLHQTLRTGGAGAGVVRRAHRLDRSAVAGHGTGAPQLCSFWQLIPDVAAGRAHQRGGCMSGQTVRAGGHDAKARGERGVRYPPPPFRDMQYVGLCATKWGGKIWLLSFYRRPPPPLTEEYGICPVQQTLCPGVA